MTTAIIAEDEPAIRREIVRLLELLWPELHVVAAVADGRRAVDAIETHEPDVAFLDIKMPEPNGIDLAKKYGDRLAVVFVTAYSEYAVEAFEHASVDYILKPLTEDRLRKTIDRLKDKIDTSQASKVDYHAIETALKSLEQRYLTWLRVSRNDTITILNVDDVCYFHAEAKYTSTFTKDYEYLLRISISNLERRLDPSQFWRIHRSTIVNIAAIKEAKRDFRRRIRLSLTERDEILNISKPYEHLFIKH